jgi:hypothetical protein
VWENHAVRPRGAAEPATMPEISETTKADSTKASQGPDDL